MVVSAPVAEKRAVDGTAADQRLAYIDTLRGLAACAVFATHVHAYWLGSVRPEGITFTRLVTFLAGAGGLGVDLFIVLSGFCLFYPLVRKAGAQGVQLNARSFFRRRAYRLLPAYYAALAVAIVLVLIPTLQPYLVARPIEIYDIVTYSLLVQTFSLHTTGSINGSFWSIALEAQLYCAFPLLIFLYCRLGMRFLLFVGIMTSVLWALLCSYLEARGWLPFSPDLHFPARWVEFIAGMAAAILVVRPRYRSRRMAALIVVLTLPLTLITRTGLITLPGFIPHLLAAITFSCLVVAMAGCSGKLFVGRYPAAVLTSIGVISYSLYLLHQPVLLLSAPLIPPLHLGILPTFGLAVVLALPLTLLLAWGFYKGIEKPFLERGKQVRYSVPH